jgi:hypothetical protein
MRRLRWPAFLLLPLSAGAQIEGRWLEVGHLAVARVATQWVQVRKSAGSLTLSRDGEKVQSLQLEIATDPVQSWSAPEHLERSVRAYRQQHSAEYLQLLAAASVNLGFWQGLRFDLGQRDENGLRWRTRVYQLSQPGRELSAVFRAPQLYFFERDLAEIEAMIRSIE